jgi:hypothetical protein
MRRLIARRKRKCKSRRVLCPSCGDVQALFAGDNGKFRGRGVATCRCGADYFHYSADGVTEVVELLPGEAANVNPDEQLPVILERLGLMERVA